MGGGPGCGDGRASVTAVISSTSLTGVNDVGGGPGSRLPSTPSGGRAGGSDFGDEAAETSSNSDQCRPLLVSTSSAIFGSPFPATCQWVLAPADRQPVRRS
jgi:hypothetical protein